MGNRADAQGFSHDLDDGGARASAGRSPARLGRRRLTFAMTSPPGTHAMWIRYWLASGGINPDKDVTLITISPPQMVANLKFGKMDGFCVGEPWNARAIADDIGFTAITPQQIWRDQPEKVLGFTEKFAEKNPKTGMAILRAMLEASQYIDRLENRPHVAEVASRPQYINSLPAAAVPCGRAQPP